MAAFLRIQQIYQQAYMLLEFLLPAPPFLHFSQAHNLGITFESPSSSIFPIFNQLPGPVNSSIVISLATNHWPFPFPLPTPFLRPLFPYLDYFKSFPHSSLTPVSLSPIQSKHLCQVNLPKHSSDSHYVSV